MLLCLNSVLLAPYQQVQSLHWRQIHTRWKGWIDWHVPATHSRFAALPCAGNYHYISYSLLPLQRLLTSVTKLPLLRWRAVHLKWTSSCAGPSSVAPSILPSLHTQSNQRRWLKLWSVGQHIQICIVLCWVFGTHFSTHHNSSSHFFGCTCAYKIIWWCLENGEAKSID